jgi:hypothetical protein
VNKPKCSQCGNVDARCFVPVGDKWIRYCGLCLHYLLAAREKALF